MGIPGQVPPCKVSASSEAEALENWRRRVAFLRAELEKPLSPARRRMLLQALREAEQTTLVVFP